MMKFLPNISIALLLVLIGANASASPKAFPGTGLNLEVPSGLSQTKAGTALIDESGETIIVFSGGETKSNLETHPTWRMLYKNPPEKIETKFIKGNLYKRTRASDGGKWDGWFFSISRGKKNLVALASYTGNSRQTFERIRETLLTIRWDDSNVQSEEAMGVRLNPEGMRVVSNAFGALSYNPQGYIGATGPSIIVQLMPVASSKVNNIFPAGCETVLNGAFPAGIHEALKFRQRAGIELCETWSSQASSEMRYVSLVKLPNGALLMLMGTSPQAQFNDFLPKVRRAVYELSPLR